MLQSDIRTKMTDAMKARDQLRTDTLRGVITAFTNELVAKGRKPTEQLSDEEAVAVLKRLGKQRREAADQYKNGGRQELAEKELNELKILQEFLPQTASHEEIEEVARRKMAEIGATDKSKSGILTGAIMKEFAGRADGADVSEVVATLLQ